MENADNESVISLQSLGWSIALLLLSLLLAAGLVLAVLYYGNLAAQSHQQALAQQAESRNRLARANEDEQEIRARITRYQELIAQGRTAPERRLDWVETLRHIKEKRRLLGLEYEIAPQRALDSKNVLSGNYSFLASQMKLEMPLLHENDLLGLLADLSAQVQALVSVRRCKVERIPQGATQHNAAMLKADCDVDWITLQEKI
jgi:hypothetical protein